MFFIIISKPPQVSFFRSKTALLFVFFQTQLWHVVSTWRTVDLLRGSSLLKQVHFQGFSCSNQNSIIDFTSRGTQGSQGPWQFYLRKKLKGFESQRTDTEGGCARTREGGIGPQDPGPIIFCCQAGSKAEQKWRFRDGSVALNPEHHLQNRWRERRGERRRERRRRNKRWNRRAEGLLFVESITGGGGRGTGGPMHLTYVGEAQLPPHTILSYVLTRQMEAKDADGSHQDICHFTATASLISDKASSPVGVGGGGVGGSHGSGCAKELSKSCGVLLLQQLVPITANHM